MITKLVEGKTGLGHKLFMENFSVIKEERHKATDFVKKD